MKKVLQSAVRQAAVLAIGFAGASGLAFPPATLASDERDADRSAAVASALQAALLTNVGHARDWHEQGDFKSLQQSASGLQLLAALLTVKGDDAAWQAALGRVETAISELQSAAKSEDATACRVALETLDKAAVAAASLKPAGRPLRAPRAPAVRPLMLILDSTYADAKIALLSGNVAAAKKQAFVLAELGELVSNSRQTEQWRSLADEFTKAASAAATSGETDAHVVRQLLRGVSQRCESCHETRNR